MKVNKGILFTRRVLDAASDDHDEILRVCRIKEGPITSWPRYYLDLADQAWVAGINFSPCYSEAPEQRIYAIRNALMAYKANLLLTDATDFATQIAAVFHTEPIGAIEGSERFNTGMRRCVPAGSLERLNGVKPYVTTPEEQLSEWVDGHPLHNYVRDECCPDFSCCGGTMLGLEDRKRFASAPDEEKVGMLGLSLSNLISDNELPAVVVTPPRLL